MTTQNKPDKKCKLWFHDWTRWSNPKDIKVYDGYSKKEGYEQYQFRLCRRCNIFQERIV